MSAKPTSWADETDELEQEAQTKTSRGNAWNKPLVPASNEYDNRSREEDREERGREDDYYERKDDYRRERREYDDGNRERGYGYRGGRGGRGRGDRDRRPPREPREQREAVPFPTQAPYIAYVGNLPYDVSKEELGNWLETRGCKVKSVRMVTQKESQRSKGYGYVEFEDADSLRSALNLNKEELNQRELRIDIAEGKTEERRNDFKSRSPLRRSEDGPSNGSPSAESEENAQRKKIEIKPRSVPVSGDASAETYKNAKVNPFGNAKPRDENFFMKKKEDERKSRPDDEPKSPEPQEEQVERSKPTEKRVDDRDRQFKGDDKMQRPQQRRDRPPREDRSFESGNRDRPPRESNFRSSDRGSFSSQRGGRGGARGGRRPDNRDDGRGPRRDDNRQRDFPKLTKKEDHVEPVSSKNIFSALGEEEAD